ncbi:TetR/AcrR family transcriptional regulator [Amycolatopsis lurida]
MADQRTSEPERKARTRMSAPQRRESILAAATEVFALTGYERGKASAVAKRIGVSEPVIFQNFGTKAALFAAVVTRAADHACEFLDHLAAQPISVPELMALLLNPAHVEQFHAPGSVGALFAEASAVTGEPEIEAAAREATQRMAAGLAHLLDRGRADGQLRADLDPEAAAWWLLSLLASRNFRHATAGDPASVESRLAETTVAFFTA